METKQELLEIYKLHVEMADRVSQRRLQTNRFYIALLSGLLALLSVMVNDKGLLEEFTNSLFIIVSILGIVLSIVWMINIHSYKQLNTGKFKAIHDLEDRLSYQFYTKEWELLKKGKSAKSYFQLTNIEKFVPLIMLIPYLLLLLYLNKFIG